MTVWTRWRIAEGMCAFTGDRWVLWQMYEKHKRSNEQFLWKKKGKWSHISSLYINLALHMCCTWASQVLLLNVSEWWLLKATDGYQFVCKCQRWSTYQHRACPLPEIGSRVDTCSGNSLWCFHRSGCICTDGCHPGTRQYLRQSVGISQIALLGCLSRTMNTWY